MTLVSAEQERRLGQEEAQKVEAQIGLLEDARLMAYLDALGQRLVRESPRRDVTYRFHIVDMAEPNAFALPGGYIYVSRGLLALMNTEDELAGVVGHEIAHVAARHTVQRISKQGPIAALFGIASGIAGLVVPLAGDIIGGIGDLTQGLIFAPYSRSQETEADRVGQDMAAQAGWDPAALSRALATLGREADLMSQVPRRPSFFDSHPPTPDRVARTSEYARTLTRPSRPPLSASAGAFVARLDGLVVGPRAARGVILGRTFLHPDANVFVEFPEKWALQQTPDKVLAVSPDREVAVLLRAAGKGQDPLDGARALEKATKSPIVARTERITINGLPAARAALQADGKVGVDVTWIAHGGTIFQVVGLAPRQRFAAVRPGLFAVAQTFRPLSAAERAGVTERRIRLITARAGETVAALAGRAQSAWSGEELAVANALAVGDRLAAGQVIKAAIAEPYRR